MNYLSSFLPPYLIEVMPPPLLLYFDLVVLILLVLFSVLFITYKKAGDRSNDEVIEKFGLSKNDYKVIHTDLGQNSSRLMLSYRGVGGVPDAIFKSKKQKTYVAGEFKGRKYRGYIRLYEYYQLMLYIGLVQRKYGKPCRGILAYDDKVVPIKFDRDVFNALIKLAPEAESRNVSSSQLALHKRVNLNLPQQVKV